MKRFQQFLLIVAILLPVSCGKEPVLEPGKDPANEHFLQSNTIDISEDAQTISFRVKENTSYNVSFSDNWISPAPSNNSKTELYFEVNKNYTTDQRTCVITIKESEGKDEATLTVNQAPTKKVSPKEAIYVISSKEQDIAIEILSNVDIGCSINEADLSWISFVQTKALESRTLSFHVKENSSYENRKAIIQIVGESISRTVLVSQSGNAIPFSDNNFKEWLAFKYDKNGDRELTSDEVGSITKMTIDDGSISSLEGLEFFPNLRELTINVGNHAFRSLDISRLTALEILRCEGNGLEELTLGSLSNLKYLSCDNNNLKELNVSGCINLAGLTCGNNQIEELDLSECRKINGISCWSNMLSTLNISNCHELELLYCDHNANLQKLDISDLSVLREIRCNDCAIKEIKMAGNYNNLTHFNCDNNLLKTLDFNKCPVLKYLDCEGNRLESLLLNNNTTIEALDCSKNSLESLVFSNMPLLESLWFGDNPLDRLVLDYIPSLKSIGSYNTKLDVLDLSTCLDIEWIVCAAGNEDEAYLKTLYIPKDNHIRGLDVSPSTLVIEKELGEGYTDIIDIKDSFFLKYLLQASIFPNSSSSSPIDQNGDGLISVYEASRVRAINMSNYKVNDLSSIEYFVNLQSLFISDQNGYLTKLDLSNNNCLREIQIFGYPKLEQLLLPEKAKLKLIQFSELAIKDIDLTGFPELSQIEITDTPLDKIDLSHNLEITRLYLGGNKFETVNTSNNTRLEFLYLYNNTIKELDLRNNKCLVSLGISGNQLERLDISKCLDLLSLYCNDNSLNILDVSNNKKLERLDCRDNPLNAIYISDSWFNNNVQVDIGYSTELFLFKQ